jgi:hypothetical protein
VHLIYTESTLYPQVLQVGYWANIPIVYAVGTPSIPCEALVRQQLLWTLRDPVANAQPRIPKAWSTHDTSTDRFPNSNTEELRHGFQGPLDPTYTKSSAPRLCIPMAISPIPNTLMMCSTSQSSDLCSRVYCRAVTQVITRTKLANLLDKETVWWVDLQVSLGCFLACQSHPARVSDPNFRSWTTEQNRVNRARGSSPPGPMRPVSEYDEPRVLYACIDQLYVKGLPASKVQYERVPAGVLLQ